MQKPACLIVRQYLLLGHTNDAHTNDGTKTMTTKTLRAEADLAKLNGDFRRAAAILAVLADTLGEKFSTDRTSPTWRECFACNAKA